MKDISLMGSRPTRCLGSHFHNKSLSRQLHTTMYLQGRRQASGGGKVWIKAGHPRELRWVLVWPVLWKKITHKGQERSWKNTAYWNLCLFSAFIFLFWRWNPGGQGEAQLMSSPHHCFSNCHDCFVARLRYCYALELGCQQWCHKTPWNLQDSTELVTISRQSMKAESHRSYATT